MAGVLAWEAGAGGAALGAAAAAVSWPGQVEAAARGEVAVATVGWEVVGAWAAGACTNRQPGGGRRTFVGRLPRPLAMLVKMNCQYGLRPAMLGCQALA